MGLHIAPPQEGTSGPVKGVVVEGRGVVHADAVVLALGPWTADAARWLQVALPPGIAHPFPHLERIEVCLVAVGNMWLHHLDSCLAYLVTFMAGPQGTQHCDAD